MRGFLIGLAVSIAFIGGCVAGASRLAVSPAKASYVVEQRWAYFCFQDSNIDDVNYKANAAGARGWELVAATSSGNGNDAIWCFRQPRP
jgi:hypothetical protein